MKTKNRAREKYLRPLTQMQFETLVACYFGELSIAMDRRYRKYIKVYHGNVDISGRLRSIHKRRLIKGHFDAGQLQGFFVTEKGIAELEKVPGTI